MDDFEFDARISICCIRVLGSGFMGRDATGFISTEESESSSDEDESLCEEVEDTASGSVPEESVSTELSLVVLFLRFVSKTPSPKFCQRCKYWYKSPNNVRGKLAISMYCSSSSPTFSRFTSSRFF